MTDPQKLNYESPQPNPRFRLQPDWRRRLLIAAIAAPVIMLLTLEASRRAQSPAVSYMEGGAVNYSVRDMQKNVDAYTRTNGSAPASLAVVPEIAKYAAQDPSYLLDPWGAPYLLISVNGKPVVISYGRDKLPGGSGLDADITADHLYGSELVTMNQFVHRTNLTPVVLLCLVNGLLIAILAFTGKTDARERRGLAVLLLQLGLKAIMALIVASVIASVHAPSGH